MTNNNISKILDLRFPFTFILSSFFLLSFIFLLVSCDTTEPNGDNGNNEPDTTSQNFTFESFEFGDGYSSSYFNDVWVFDENNIWAVGWVRPAPKTGGIHNIVRWDGNEWSGLGGQFTSSGLYGIWAEDTSDIFFAAGAVIRYKSGEFTEYNLGHLGFSQGQSVQKLWGSGADNIWGVGPWGTIVHFNGSEWSKIDYDTSWVFKDICSGFNDRLFAIAHNLFSSNVIILEFLQNKIDTLYTDLYTDRINVHWQQISNPVMNKIWLAGNGIWQLDINSGSLSQIYTGEYGIAINVMSDKNANDIYFGGTHIDDEFYLGHYNGNNFTEILRDAYNHHVPGGISSDAHIAAYGGRRENNGYLILIRRFE
ncbi:MAG: hypothetical protein K9J12_18110 [Melioribacteraceae bacterium]|nr:hypothetical protein [Melioribacteraceae bacterium]MCF8263735.1 hypothetical protein [Melioribacteraceae bacterium]MCF8432647.1 hypothetical protein [Melioribacteraceae bacterium]